ncbi:MAG: hypothetical protein L3J39_18065 [Verrucomicrobiales bacterium]|nr:hypothetical protein [Verrucomicrobiales bacterium]
MKAQTELLLYQLLWTAEQLSFPTFRNLSTSFESWAYSKKLLRVVRRLESEHLLETQGGDCLDRVVLLTEKGRQMIVGDRDPEKEWQKAWDGIWRMVLFDIPETQRELRRELRGVLHAHHFGCFQQSVWLSPHTMDAINQMLAKKRAGLARFTLMEGRLLFGEKDTDVVASSWDFPKLNRKYEVYIQFVKKHLDNKKKSHQIINSDNVLAMEKSLWESAVRLDPLLPEALLPKGYLGQKANSLRKKMVTMMMKALLGR